MKNPLEGIRSAFSKSENNEEFDKAGWTATLDARYPEFRGGLMLGGFTSEQIEQAEKELFDKVKGDVEAITPEMIVGGPVETEI